MRCSRVLPQKNNPTLVVTNPLHYTYFFRDGNVLPAIGSGKCTLSKDYWSELCGDTPIQLYPVENRLEKIIAAHEEAKNGANADYVTWKAVDMPLSFLGNPFSLRDTLERKATIRSLLDPALFPEFKIVEVGSVDKKDYATLADMVNSERMVIQVDYSTGGRGTYFIDSEADFLVVRDDIMTANQTQRLVVSKRVAGSSFAIQCFVADGNVQRMNWWHRDLVAVEGVYNNLLSGAALQSVATKYCGAVLQNIPTEYLDQVEALTQKVGTVLVAQGWRGIFGMDFVVDDASDKIYLIEINPRFTAVSHVYATAMRAVGCATDFMTEQVKGLIGKEATSFQNMDASLPNVYFYLKLQNTRSTPVRLRKSCRLGVYRNFTNKSSGFGIEDLKNEDDIVVIPEGDVAAVYAPGDRTYGIIGIGEPTDNGNVLNSQTKDLIHRLRQTFEEQT